MEKLKIEREKLGKNKKEEKENINGNADNGIRFSFAFSLQET